MVEQTLENVSKITDHIQAVQRRCQLLGNRLIKSGEVTLGTELISQGQLHDNSKLLDFEFKHLHDIEDPNFAQALHAHRVTNKHHPEYWNGIENMPDVCLAEMVCDLSARAAEFGTDLRDYVNTVVLARYNVELDSPAIRFMHRMMDILLNSKFGKV